MYYLVKQLTRSSALSKNAKSKKTLFRNGRWLGTTWLVAIFALFAAPSFAATRTITVRVEWGTPVVLAVVQPGDRVRIEAQLGTSDTTVPETIENESLILSLSSGGLDAAVSQSDAVNTFQIDKVAPDPSPTGSPTLTAYFSGYDGDEYADVTIIVNPVDPLQKSASDIQHWEDMAQAFHNGELAAEAAELHCPPVRVCEPLEQATALVYGALANHYEELALDPPDPNFTAIALPVTPSVPVIAEDSSTPTAVTDAANALLENERQSIGLLDAIMTSINRASGAMQANDSTWQLRQTQAAVSYFIQLSGLTAEQPTLRAALQSEWNAAGLPAFAVTAGDLHATQLNLFSNGFSADETQQFLLMGLSADEITHVKNVVVALDYNEVALEASFPANLTYQPTIDTLSQGAQSFRDIVFSNAVPLSTGQKVFGAGTIQSSLPTPIGFAFRATIDSHGTTSPSLRGGLLLVDFFNRFAIEKSTITKAFLLGHIAIIDGTYVDNNRGTGTFEIVAGDNSDHGRGNDTFSITLSNGYQVNGTLTLGDIKIMSGPSVGPDGDSDDLRLP